MDNGVIRQAESDDKILTFDVPDEAIELAASTPSQCFTAPAIGTAAVGRRLQRFSRLSVDALEQTIWLWRQQRDCRKICRRRRTAS
jgi:hypothetical protein